MVHRINEQIPFHDLICASCRSATDERLPELDYAIKEIVVEMNDGTKVPVPTDITDFDIEYDSGGRSLARILARVPCPSCHSPHQIDISAVRKAPVVELRQTTCPNCESAICEISRGLKIRYRSKGGDAWVEASAELTCPSCAQGNVRTASLDPEIFDVEGDNVIFVDFRGGADDD
jgi:hypothetical protein